MTPEALIPTSPISTQPYSAASANERDWGAFGWNEMKDGNGSANSLTVGSWLYSIFTKGEKEAHGSTVGENRRYTTLWVVGHLGNMRPTAGMRQEEG